MKPKNLYLFDVYKFISSLLVIALHVQPMLSYGPMAHFLINQGVTRIAVPMFFAIAGYLLAKRGFEKQAVFKYLKRIILLYAIWSVIYLTISDFKLVSDGRFNFEAISSYLFKVLYSGSYLHFWYFPALIFAVFVLWLMLKKLSINAALAVSGVLYAVTMLAEPYSKLAQYVPPVAAFIRAYLGVFHHISSGLFVGLPFVTLGAWLSANDEKLRFRPSVCYGLCAGTFILVYAEIFAVDYFKLAYDYLYFLSLVPFAAALIILAVNVPLSEKGKDVFVWLRKSSILIYASQPLIRVWFDRLCVALGVVLYGQSLVYYFVNVALAVAFAALVLRLERVRGMGFLKYLH